MGGDEVSKVGEVGGTLQRGEKYSQVGGGKTQTHRQCQQITSGNSGKSYLYSLTIKNKKKKNAKVA